MAARRLVPQARVDAWEARLRAAADRALREQLVPLRRQAEAAGLSLTAAGRPGRPVLAALTGMALYGLWAEERWARLVAQYVEPEAQAIEAEAAGLVSSAVPTAAAAGFAASGAMSSAVVGLAVGAGAAIGSRVADAAGGSDPSTALSAVLTTAGAILGGVVGAMAQAIANSVTSELGSYVTSTTQPQSSGTKTWNAMDDDRTREWHADADGDEVPVGEPFSVDGEDMMYPGDPDGSDENTINCFPADVVVSAVGVTRSYRRWYEGPLVRVKTAGGNELAGTPNHPVLTRSGWVALGSLHEGDDVVGGFLGRAAIPARDPDVAHRPAPIGEVHRALVPTGDVQRVVGAPRDFHGDGSASQVEVVTPHGLLGDESQAVADEAGELALPTPDERGSALERSSPLLRSADNALGWVHAPASGLVGGSGESTSTLGPLALHPEPVRSRAAADLHAARHEPTTDRVSPDARAECDALLALASNVAIDYVVDVESHAFAGHVFTLQTSGGWFIANGIVARNCRCWLTVDGSFVSGAAEDYQGEAA